MYFKKFYIIYYGRATDDLLIDHPEMDWSKHIGRSMTIVTLEERYSQLHLRCLDVLREWATSVSRSLAASERLRVNLKSYSHLFYTEDTVYLNVNNYRHFDHNSRSIVPSNYR